MQRRMGWCVVSGNGPWAGWWPSAGSDISEPSPVSLRMRQPPWLNRPLRGLCAKPARSLVTSMNVIRVVMYPLAFIFLLLESSRGRAACLQQVGSVITSPENWLSPRS